MFKKIEFGLCYITCSINYIDQKHIWLFVVKADQHYPLNVFKTIDWVMIWALFSTVLTVLPGRDGPSGRGTSNGWLSMESTFFWHSRVRKKYGGGSTPNWVSHKPSWMNTSPDRLFFAGKGWGTWENGEGLCRKHGMSKSKEGDERKGIYEIINFNMFILF